CLKHMTGNLKLLINFVEKFLGTVKFGIDQIAPILGYGDLVQGDITIKRVYYVEGLNHNLFSVGQFYDADFEVAFRKSTYFIRDLKGNDLLSGSRRTDLYSITLQDTNSPNPICLVAKVTSSQAWLWHRHLSYLNFDTINLLSKNDIVVGLPKVKFVKDHLCSFSELGKAKRKSFHTKLTPSSKRRLQLLHIDLCGPMRVASINGKIYVLVIVDDYSRYTWTHFLRSKDETPETLHAYFAAEGIQHQTSVARTPEQNGIIERRNRTLVEAARTMLSTAKFKSAIQRQGKVTQADRTVTTSNELDLLFSLMFDELLNGSSKVVSKSSAVSAADAPNQHQRQNLTTSLTNHTTPAPTCQILTLAPTVISPENINQAETYAENDQVADDEFINIFSTLVQDQGETSFCRTRRQLESDAEM
nr:retrovirus-related Pol polyprotein from transposon TNT 1-94 [Tanacetum cinerariifolium]